MFSGPASGLYLSPNPFKSVPDGSLKVADNVIFSAPSVMEPRRGQNIIDEETFGSGSAIGDALAFFAGQQLVHYDLTTVAIRDDAGDFSDFSPTYVANGSHRLRFEGAARSVFFNPDSGIQVLDDVEGAPSDAGCAQGLNIIATNNSNDGWQTGNTAVAYRFTVCRKDVYGRVVEGPPSGRTVLRNLIRSVFPTDGVTRSANVVNVSTEFPHGLTTGDVVVLSPALANFPAGAKVITVDSAIQFHYAEVGANATASATQTWDITRSADLSLYFPAGLTTANFLRVYRSAMTAVSTDVPEDELFQCYESAFLLSTDIVAGFMSFQDVTPESVLENPLYTNPNTGDGTLAANYRPPIAEDLVYWQDRMWYLNTTSLQSVELALIGVGAPDGLQDGDEISFTRDSVSGPGEVFTAKLVPAGAADFQLFDDGDPSYNIQRTAQALCQVVNDGGIFVNAFYVSSETGQPGKMLFARADDDTNDPFIDGFKIYSSRATTWTPQLPTFVDPAFTALASSNNRHSARLWYSKLGQPEAVPLLNYIQIAADNNEALRVFPLDYRLLVFKTDGIYFVPSGLPVSYQKLSDYVLIAPDSVARLGDEVFCLTDQGVIAIGASGVRMVSEPINEALAALNGPTSIDDLKERAVACAYRSEEQYILWTIQKNEGLNTFTDDNAQAWVYSARSRGWTRYTFGVRAAGIDPDLDLLMMLPTVASSHGNADHIQVERKTRTDADYTDTFIVDDELPIECEVKFNDFTDGEPATMKMAQQVSFLFRENGVSDVVAEFASELHPVPVEVTMSSNGWGEFAWGEVPWGCPVRAIRRVEPLPEETGNCCQLSVGFSTAQAGVKFAFLGVDVVMKRDTRVNRG